MLCKILIINMLDYKFKRFIFNNKLTMKPELQKSSANKLTMRQESNDILTIR